MGSIFSNWMKTLQSYNKQSGKGTFSWSLFSIPGEFTYLQSDDFLPNSHDSWICYSHKEFKVSFKPLASINKGAKRCK